MGKNVNYAVTCQQQRTDTNLTAVREEIENISPEKVSDAELIDLKEKWAAAAAEHLDAVLPKMEEVLHALKGNDVDDGDFEVYTDGELNFEGAPNVNGILCNISGINVTSNQYDTLDEDLPIFDDDSTIVLYPDELLTDRISEDRAEALGMPRKHFEGIYTSVGEFSHVARAYVGWLRELSRSGRSSIPKFDSNAPALGS